MAISRVQQERARMLYRQQREDRQALYERYLIVERSTVTLLLLGAMIGILLIVMCQANILSYPVLCWIVVIVSFVSGMYSTRQH